MAITLYYFPGSAPGSQVLLTAKALNLDVELKVVDLMNKKQLEPEYVKINPQHTVPTLVDGDFVLWESRTIARYLVSKYGANTTLYPQEPRARAVVDQRLDFDMGTLYSKYAEYFYPQLLEKKAPEEAKLVKLQEALGFLNVFLEGNQYVAGNELTIADFAIVCTVATIEASGVDLKPYPNIVRWFSLVKSKAVGYQEIVQKSIDAFKGFIENSKSGK